MAVMALGSRGTCMSLGYSAAVGGAKNPNVPSPLEGLDELFLLRYGQGMSTGILSSTQHARGATGPYLTNISVQGINGGVLLGVCSGEAFCFGHQRSECFMVGSGSSGNIFHVRLNL